MATEGEKLTKLLMNDDKWKSTLFPSGQRMNNIRSMQHDLGRVFRLCSVEYRHVTYSKRRDWVRQIVLPQFPKWYVYENGVGFVEPAEEDLITKIQQRLRSERKVWSSRLTNTTTSTTTTPLSTGSQTNLETSEGNEKKRLLVDRDMSSPLPMEIESAHPEEEQAKQKSKPSDADDGGSREEHKYSPTTVPVDELAAACTSMDETIFHLTAQVEQQDNKLDQLYKSIRDKQAQLKTLRNGLENRLIQQQQQKKKGRQQQQRKGQQRQQQRVIQASPYNEDEHWGSEDETWVSEAEHRGSLHFSTQECWTPFPMPWE